MEFRSDRFTVVRTLDQHIGPAEGSNWSGDVAGSSRRRRAAPRGTTPGKSAYARVVHGAFGRCAPPSRSSRTVISARLETSVQRDSSHRVWAAQEGCQLPGSSRLYSWKTAIQPNRVAPLVARSTKYWHTLASRWTYKLADKDRLPSNRGSWNALSLTILDTPHVPRFPPLLPGCAR